MSIVDKLKEKGKKFKEEAYKFISKTGSKLEKTIEDAKPTIDTMVEKIEDGAKKTYEFMQRADGKIEKAVLDFTDAYDDVSAKVRVKYADLKNTFYTDGTYDSRKTEEFFKDSGKVALKFGEKTGKELYELAKKGLMKTKEDYHKVIPYDWELEGKYAGVGTTVDHWLFRNDYENCLTYHAEAAGKLHPNTKHRDEILADIKATASNSTYDLKKHYLEQPGKLVLGKLETVKKYLEA